MQLMLGPELPCSIDTDVSSLLSLAIAVSMVCSLLTSL